MNQLRPLALACLAATALTPVMAHAQAVPAKPAANASVDVGEVIVTAQRREERLISVPISITAANQTQLTQNQVTNTRDLTTIAPGLSAAMQGFAFQPSIRGVGTTSTALGDEPNVALYIDNVYVPFMAGNAFGLKNIERIEVLKGPQGTLFGRNATGGAIRIVTSDPTFDTTGSISADYGFKLHSRAVNAYASTGITDKIALGVSIYGYDDDGYVRNVGPLGGKVADSQEITTRAKLLITPTDNLRIIVGAHYANTRTSTAFATTIVDGVSAFKNVAGVILPPDKSVDPFTASLSFDPYVKNLAAGSDLTIKYDVGDYTLTSVTSYNKYILKFYLDSDRTNLDLSQFWGNQTTKVATQEFDLASNYKGPVNYVAGLYLYKNDSFAPFSLNFSAPLGPVVNGTRAVRGGTVNNANTEGFATAKSVAAFGEATWNITDALTVIGGYRYTWEKKDATAHNLFTNAQFSGEDTWKNSSVRATARYMFNEHANVYATYSTGFKSGVFNPTAVSNPLQKANPEELKAFEVGFKGEAGIFTILASAFHYDYNNIQLQTNNVLNPAAGTTILQNAASAKIEGADLQVGARLAEGLTAQLGVSWIPTAEYTKFLGGLNFVANPGGVGMAAVPTDLSGSRMIRTPKSTVDLGLNYRTEVANGDLNLSANYFWSDKFFWIAGGASNQDAYNTLSARIAWTTPDKRLTYSLWGRNLTNEVYWLQAGGNTGGLSGSYAPPREFGVGVNAAF
jgi:iron complex outermembrane receptor protein